MTWFRVDDQWHSHRKVLGLSLAARGLWVTAGSWCGAHLTDGVVPLDALRAWGATAKHAAELVAAGLWEVLESGWQFHEWTAHNPTREQVQSERDCARERMRRLRRSSPDVRPNFAARSPEVRDSRPDPSRPVPSHVDAAPEPPALAALIAQHHADRSGTLAASSKEMKAAKEIARVLGDGWPEAYARWTADPWVAEKRPPLQHLADNPTKYASETEAAAEPADTNPYRGLEVLR